MPAGVALPIVMMVANLFLAYQYLDSYKVLMAAK
jgi:hypothetical protein